eukprot:2596497-Pyramimonas_sp.AAC.1
MHITHVIQFRSVGAHYTTLHYTTLRYATLHYATLHYANLFINTTLHYAVAACQASESFHLQRQRALEIAPTRCADRRFPRLAA